MQDLFTLPEHLRSPLVFWWGSCFLFFSFLCCVMYTIVCLFVLFIFNHDVVSLFSIYEFDCPSGIFRPSFGPVKSFKPYAYICMYAIYDVFVPIFKKKATKVKNSLNVNVQ